jgi:exodeoxyribonuclease VII large subunit
VARAIFGARVPVISAVGHETDYTIADFVADLRAPTPSAAAELVVPDITDISMRVRSLAGMLAQMTAERMRDARADLEWQRDVLQRRCPDVSVQRTAVEERLRWATEYAMRGVRAKLAELGGRYAQLHALSPLSTLARGYAVVQHAPDGPVVASVGDVTAGDRLRVSVADGEIEAVAE